MNAPAGPKRRVDGLDALRGLAALSVLVFHYSFRLGEMYPDAAPAPFGFPYGLYGVQLFFMISGFVIVMSLGRNHGEGFLRARFFRLYPVFWASMLLTAIIAWLAPLPGQRVGALQFLANLTMAPDYLRIEAIDGVYWSLAYELGFYGFMYAVFAFRRERWLAFLPAAWIAAAALYGVASPYIPSPLHYFLMIHPFSHLFACGLVFHFIWTQGWRWRHGAMLAAALVVQAMVHGVEGLVSLSLGMVLFAAALSPRVARLPGMGVLIRFGAISYPLYLIHQMIGYRLILSMQAAGAGWAPSVLATTSAMIALAAALTFGVERPVYRRFGKRSAKPAPEPQVTLENA